MLIAITLSVGAIETVCSVPRRLSDQAQRHLQDSEKFEDILLGPNRPTLVVERYRELYTQGRVDALDVINSIECGETEETEKQAENGFAIQLLLDVLEVCMTTK